MSRSKPTVPQPSATFSVSLILGSCFCASLYAAAVRKPRECTESDAARGRVERMARMDTCAQEQQWERAARTP